MKDRNAGFTLVELLLVVMILATTAALVAPSFRGFYAGRQLADAAARLSVLLRRARTKAATEQLRVRLNIDPDSRIYWLTVEADPFGAPGAFVPPGDAWGRRFTLPNGVQLSRVTIDGEDAEPVAFESTSAASASAWTPESGSAYRIAFEPGGAAPDAVITITLASADNENEMNAMQVRLRGLTGEVRIESAEEPTDAR